MREGKKNTPVKPGVNSVQKGEESRHPEYETPSQRRNRDGKGRGKSGSDGSSNMGRGSNH